jgi:hypothetical protein
LISTEKELQNLQVKVRPFLLKIESYFDILPKNSRVKLRRKGKKIRLHARRNCVQPCFTWQEIFKKLTNETHG